MEVGRERTGRTTTMTAAADGGSGRLSVDDNGSRAGSPERRALRGWQERGKKITKAKAAEALHVVGLRAGFGEGKLRMRLDLFF